VPDYDLAFDCGEGMASHLGNRTSTIRNLFLSHGHHDHISGIFPLIMARTSGMTDKTQPLRIYYPRKSSAIQKLRDFIASVDNTNAFEREWIPLDNGMEILLPNQKETKHPRVVRAFEVEHGKAHAMGFSLIELGKKLNPELVGKSEHQIRELANAFPDYPINVDTRRKLLVYSGDAVRMPLAEAKNCEVLIHDTTFLKPEDRKEPTHATLGETLAFSQEAQVKTKTLLHHISPRYNRLDVETAQAKLPSSCILIPPSNKPNHIQICRGKFQKQPNIIL
jgi:ribonuclease Z